MAKIDDWIINRIGNRIGVNDPNRVWNIPEDYATWSNDRNLSKDTESADGFSEDEITSAMEFIQTG